MTFNDVLSIMLAIVSFSCFIMAIISFYQMIQAGKRYKKLMKQIEEEMNK